MRPTRMLYRGSLSEYRGTVGTVLDDQDHPGRYLFLVDHSDVVLRRVRRQSLDCITQVLD